MGRIHNSCGHCCHYTGPQGPPGPKGDKGDTGSSRGFIIAGDGITISGVGTFADPYVITNTGGGGETTFTYLQPDGVSNYFQPDGVSLYLQP